MVSKSGVFLFLCFSCSIQTNCSSEGPSESLPERTFSDASTQIDPALLAHQVTTIINIKKHAQLFREKQRMLDDVAFKERQKLCRCCIPSGPSPEIKALADQITKHQISLECWQKELARIHKELPYRYRRTIHDKL